MARHQTVILATGSAQDRAALAPLFQDTEAWTCIDATSGAQALEAATRYGDRLTLLLIDHALLDAHGLAALQRLHASDTVDCPPVILLLPHGDTIGQHVPEDIFISESLATPIDPRAAARRLAVVMELHAYQMRDVSYQHLVSRDPLIGLLSGRALRLAVEKSLVECGDTPGIMAIINMDNTRAVNERHGYHFGDLVLVDTARILADTLPAGAIIGRPHGDTFCAYIPDRPRHTENLLLLEKLKETLRREYPDAPGGPQEVTCCIGVAEFPAHGHTFRALYEAAEAASSAAKQTGRNVLLLYSDALRSHQPAHSDALRVMAENDYAIMPTVDWFTPILGGTDDRILGYDYIALPIGTGVDTHQQAIDQVAGMPTKSMVHHLRVNIKRSFHTLHGIAKQGVSLPLLSIYTVLRSEQAEMLPHILQEALAAHPIDASLVCVNIAQDMVLEMSPSRLDTLARDVRALGFSFGIHNVGEQFIVNACYVEHLFDRVLFRPDFTQSLLSGYFPQGFLGTVLGTLQKSGTEIVFGKKLTPVSKLSLSQSLGEDFSSFGEMLQTKERFIEHLASHPARTVAPRTLRESIPFRISDDGYSEIFALSGIILFDWQPHTDKFVLSESYAALHGPPKPGARLMDLLTDVTHPEDRERFIDLLLDVKHGRPNAEGIFRVNRFKEDPDTYRWRRFFLVSIGQMSSGIVSHVYCISFDVDRERREMQDFMRKAETDPLTQLFNRGGTEGRIVNFLQGDGKDGQHALLIIDLDDFKSLNDRLGHITGDKALQYIANEMQKLFRLGDIIGRIGGDEFMVFLKNIASESMIASRAQDICNAAKRAPAEWQMGCTIGIARYPADGMAFQTLYARADLALYHAKNKGKNRHAFYAAGSDE